MKIVRLVLLLSLGGISAGCNGGAITEPETSAKVAPAPIFDSTAPDTTSRDASGPLLGSGT